MRIDTRWAAPADPESMHRLAKKLIALKPDLLLSQSTPATSALLQETRTIPVIFGIVADPIGSGFVAFALRTDRLAFAGLRHGCADNARGDQTTWRASTSSPCNSIRMGNYLAVDNLLETAMELASAIKNNNFLILVGGNINQRRSARLQGQPRRSVRRKLEWPPQVSA